MKPRLSKRDAQLPECNALLLAWTMNGKCGNDGSCGHEPMACWLFEAVLRHSHTLI